MRLTGKTDDPLSGGMGNRYSEQRIEGSQKESTNTTTDTVDAHGLSKNSYGMRRRAKMGGRRKEAGTGPDRVAFA